MESLIIKTEDEALSYLAKSREKQINIDENSLAGSFEWAKLDVYVPNPPVDASITPSMMEAYIRLQKSIYQTVALAKYGEGHILKLSADEKEKYEINVVVKPGSSDQSVDLQAILTNLGHDLADKMTSDQIFWFLVLVAVLYTSQTAWRYFLQDKKEGRLAEISNKDKQRTLESIEALSAQETARMKTILTAVSDKPLSQEVARRAEITHEAFLKAVSEGSETAINAVTVPPDVAQELRTNIRRRASIYVVEKEMRVIDVNTQDAFLTVVYLEDPTTLDVTKLQFKDAVLSDASRPALFSALEKRGTASIKMRVKDLEGEITPLELLQVSEVTSIESSNPEGDKLEI